VTKERVRLSTFLQKTMTLLPASREGIGYAYIDKVARDEVRMAELANRERFLARLEELAPQKEKEIEAMGGDPKIVRDPELIKRYLELGERFAAYVTDVSREINQALDEGKNVMAEAAQGSHLDVIHGTQKFVTSSSTIAGSACANLGVGPTRVDNVIAIVKAYITRVGEGPLPTELSGELGERIQRAGGEFGTTTGRGRRCGWFDAVACRYASRLNGCDELALMKLDVLDGFEEVKICVAYELDGVEIDYLPQNLDDVKPVYKSFKGWEKSVGARRFEDLPQEAQEYVKVIEEITKTKVGIISTSPEREDTIIL